MVETTVGFRSELQQAIHGHRLINRLEARTQQGGPNQSALGCLVKSVFFCQIRSDRFLRVLAILATSDLQPAAISFRFGSASLHT